MKEFSITFWKEPYNSGSEYVKNIESFLTTAIVTQSSDGDIETFHIKLADIGLDSEYGEFDIIRNDGLWQTTDLDSAKHNLLKWNIIGALDMKPS